MTPDPIVELDPGFSAEDGRATPWVTALALLERAEVFWLSTVRADGRPHVTPLVAVWLDEALYFCTGEGEQKEKNIQRNPQCILTTGCNNFREGLDLVIEGDAVQIRDETRLQRLAELWKSKYDWPYDICDGVFHHPGSEGKVPVFEVAPTKAFAYARGSNNSATRYRFNPGTTNRPTPSDETSAPELRGLRSSHIAWFTRLMMFPSGSLNQAARMSPMT